MALLFEGLPAGWQALLTLSLVVVVVLFLWSGLLFVRARHAALHPPPVPAAGADGFTWVFLVPALNEEMTIRDSVQRLLGLDLARRVVLVIDDGSDDRTAEALAAISHPNLFVLRREAPLSREGKAAALNQAYRCLSGVRDRERTIVVVVDADGRLHPDGPSYAAAHFENPAVGGVQSQVRIYNRQHLLTWLQDVEFGVYGRLFQAGRDFWGTAGMGGNGQFNRLTALDDLVEGDGPWRDRLTEDQDLGLRLVARGWEGRQDLRATVDQQGVSRLRPLLRQRTRWSQGNLQAIGLAGEVWRSPFLLGARLEQLAYLLMPFWQGLVGLGVVAALLLSLTGTAPLWGDGPTWQLAIVYMLAFGGTILGCVASRSPAGPRGWLTGLLIAHIYVPYTWFLWPVLLRSTARQLTQRGEWSKTEREPVAAGIERPAPYGRPAPTG